MSVIFKRSSHLHEQFTMCYLGAKVSSLRRCTRDIWETLKGQTWGRRFNQLFSATHYQPCLQLVIEHSCMNLLGQWRILNTDIDCWCIKGVGAVSCYTMVCFVVVIVLVFPEDSVAGRVVEGERGTLGSRSQRHAGWWSKKAPKLSFPSDYTPYILFLIIINTAMVLIASSGPAKAPQIVPSFIQTSVTSYMPIAQPLSGLTRYKRSLTY